MSLSRTRISKVAKNFSTMIEIKNCEINYYELLNSLYIKIILFDVKSKILFEKIKSAYFVPSYFEK
jgi:hypothetical protein